MLKESFPPLLGEKPAILILGSLPGDESLRQRQYYAHRCNAFWRIMGNVFHFDPELPYAERLQHLKNRRIAVWDMVAAGRRTGSLDSRIEEVRLNDIAGLLRREASIRRIGCNGTVAFKFLKRGFPDLSAAGLSIVRLPSTSPAAAAIRFEDKLAAWRDFLAAARSPEA